MTALLEAAIIWQPDDFVLFKKCGEITISPDIQNIGYNCLFCIGTCLKPEIFLIHLQQQHKEEVFKLYENQNQITLVDQQWHLEESLSKELMLNFSEVDLNKNFNNTPINTNTKSNQLQNSKESKELKENCVFIANEENLSSTQNLNLVYGKENKALPSPNQDLDLTLNSCQNLIKPLTSITSTNSNTFTSTSNFASAFAIPAKCISVSSSTFKSLPDDYECGVGDGEDSGIMLVKSPCHSVCGDLSDCMLFTEDSSSKSTHNDTLSMTSEYVTKQSKTLNKYKESKKAAKGKYFKTPAMRKALNNKVLIEYLLEAYRKHEKLWNPKHPSYKYNAQRTMYKELSQPLLNDKKCSLTGDEIFGIITQLRGRYRRELKKFEMRKGKHRTRLWYFEKMDFLRQIIEEKRKERDKNKNYNENENVKVNALTNRQILSYLLELYCQNECLWNLKLEEYATCTKTEIYKKISEQLKKHLNIDMTHLECMNEIKKLRIRYRKELRILHKLKGLYIPKLWCFDEMEFLRPIMDEQIVKYLKKIDNKTLPSITQRKYDFQKAAEIKFDNLEEQLKFIEIYRSCNSLWNVDHPDYRSTYYRRKALNKMLELVNLTLKNEERKFKLEELEKTIHLLRKDFSNEKQKRLTKNELNEKSVMSFNLYEKLNEFLRLNLGPFSCENCQRICKTIDQYKIHKSEHDGTLPFVCTLCGKGFQMPGNLTIHIRRHRRDFPYSCKICQKTFATSTEVNIHTRCHTGERPYRCKWCDKTFKTWSFYNLHNRNHFNESSFHCPICDKTFYERNRFTDHMNVHLNIRKHQCDQCGKGFTTVGNLKKHLELHASIKKYK